MSKIIKKQLIGTTSWLVPGTYYENARLVAQFVDFVELLVYTWDSDTKNLLESELPKLNHLTEVYGLKYTVHLPTDNFENVKKALDFLEGKLEIINYVVHPYVSNEFEEFLRTFEKVSVENLKERVYYSDRMVIDIGHHLTGEKVELNKVKKITEIHLMGVKDGKDHLSIDEKTLSTLHDILGDELFDIELLCFEIFSMKDFIESLVTWQRWKERLSKLVGDANG
uniref:Sugar phosphate isomerase/epimerase n=1 Tax=Fervidobacterium nodosum TaxID=2424 RepID=A0A7C5U5Y5_9BACT